MAECKWCRRDRPYPCANSRDMEDFAIDGEDECLKQLVLLGGGEKGLRHVVLNKLAKLEAGDG